ncbi:MAG: diacylglycerol kinase (ATP) [Flavobacterium sp.]|jgi:diacylglycerol kinase (ATP)
MANSGKKGLSRIISAAGYSWQGVCAAWQNEEAFRQEIVICAVMIPLGFFLAETRMEAAMLVGSVMLLPIVEILNSSIEATIDRIGLERHELSARAKDMGSAAVTMTIIFVATIWLLLLMP